MPIVNLAEARAKLLFGNSERVIEILRRLHGDMKAAMMKDEDKCFAKFKNKFDKKLLAIDFFAESTFAKMLTAEIGEAVHITGEESLPPSGVDYSDSTKLHVLCDMIDGTDLLVRGMSNWCSAFIAFEPASRKILAAHVYVVDRGVDVLYSAFSDKRGTHLSEFRTHVYLLEGKEFVTVEDTVQEDEFVSKETVYGRTITTPVKQRRLAGSGLFSYGQKHKNFKILADFLLNRDVSRALENTEDVRIYNLAGNPILCRLVEGKADLVFDLSGQAAHDVIPGAFIALKAGAVMYGLPSQVGEPVTKITADDLIRFAMRPCPEDTRLRYVVASNAALAEDFLELCRSAKVL